MINNQINIKIIETAINKGIRDMKDDPKRGIRNLVDLASHFASSSFQRNTLKLMQNMLSNLNSPYYDRVSYLVSNVDHDIIKTFGINIGYNSWTCGAKKIRNNKKDYDCNIPWTIIFNLTKEKEDKLTNNNILEIIKGGKYLGIYTYMLFLENLDGFEDILKENSDCAFILYLPFNSLTEEKIKKINSYNNTAFSILYEKSMDTINFKNTIELLHKNKSLFGLYSYYNDDNINDILNDEWVHKIVSAKSSFGILIESKNCNKKNASLVKDYVSNSKTNQEHYAFLINLYEDISKINKNISVNSFIFTIMGSR